MPVALKHIRYKKGLPMGKRIAVKLPDELHRAVKIRAAVTGKTIAEVVREALEEWVGEDPLAGYEPKKKESPKK